MGEYTSKKVIKQLRFIFVSISNRIVSFFENINNWSRPQMRVNIFPELFGIIITVKIDTDLVAVYRFHSLHFLFLRQRALCDM